MKNVFEELIWHAYLTPRPEAARVTALANHLIVAIL